MPAPPRDTTPVRPLPLALYLSGVGALFTRLAFPGPTVDLACDISLLLVLCAIPWALDDRRARFRTLKLLSLSNAVYFGLTGILFLIMEQLPKTFRLRDYGFLYREAAADPLAVLDKGVLLVIGVQAIFLAVFMIGRDDAKPRASRLAKRIVDTIEYRPILTSIALAAVLTQATPQHVPLAIRNILFDWGLLLDAIWMARLVRWFRMPRRNLGSAVPWLWIVGLKVMIALYTGWKGMVLIIALGLAIVFVIERGRLPVRWIVPVAAVAILVWYPWADAYKSIISHGQAQSRVTAAREAFDRTRDLSAKDRVVDGIYQLAVRLGTMRLDELSGVAARDIRLHGESIYPFLTAPIPRIVWPSKPQLSPRLNKIAHDLGKGDVSSLSTSVVWTQYTDLYLNFGIEGLMIGAVLIALFAKGLNRRLVASSVRSPESIGIFYVLFAPLWLEFTMGFVFQNEVQLLILLAAVLALASGMRHLGSRYGRLARYLPVGNSG